MSSAAHRFYETSYDPSAGATGAVHHSSRLVERQSVLIGAQVSPGGEQWLPGRVTDISSQGCRLVTADGLAAGIAVHIMFPGFAARGARVVWADGEQAGCAFDMPLPDAILDYIIRMSDPAARG